jgi:AcrR family transcriptional regulator
VTRSKATPESKIRILDAAERLFTEHGFDATSVRRITTEAGVPLALVNYHFGSKQGLMEAVYARALGRRDSQRMGYLDRLEAEAGGAPIPVATLVDAFIDSARRLDGNSALPGAVFKQLIGRAFYAPGEGGGAFFPAEYRDMVDRYKRAFVRALPHLDEAEVIWRMYFFVGMVAYVMAGKDVMRMFELDALAGQTDVATAMDQLRPFIAAGFQAPGRAGQAGVDT